MQASREDLTMKELLPYKTFPFKVPIEENDEKTCTYEQKEKDKAGSMECDDGTNFECKVDDLSRLVDPRGPSNCSPSGMHAWKNQAVCSVGDPESAAPAVRPYREYYPGYYLKCYSQERCDYDFQILYNDHGPANADGYAPCGSGIVWQEAPLLEKGLFPLTTSQFHAVLGTDNSPQCTYTQDVVDEPGYFECYGDLLVDCVKYDPPLTTCDDRPEGYNQWRFTAKCVVSNPK